MDITRLQRQSERWTANEAVARWTKMTKIRASTLWFNFASPITNGKKYKRKTVFFFFHSCHIQKYYFLASNKWSTECIEFSIISQFNACPCSWIKESEIKIEKCKLHRCWLCIWRLIARLVLKWIYLKIDSKSDMLNLASMSRSRLTFQLRESAIYKIKFKWKLINWNYYRFARKRIKRCCDSHHIRRFISHIVVFILRNHKIFTPQWTHNNKVQAIWSVVLIQLTVHIWYTMYSDSSYFSDFKSAIQWQVYRLGDIFIICYLLYIG